jgi:hypothetical protein
MIVWLQFLACTAAIVFAGTKLSKYGDIIDEKRLPHLGDEIAEMTGLRPHLCRLTPLLTHTFTLDQIGEAYELFGERRDGVMKVAIKS